MSTSPQGDLKVKTSGTTTVITQDEQESALKVLNRSPRELLLQYKVFNSAYGRMQLDAILDHIQKHGPLKSISEISHIKFLSTKVSGQICNNIVKSLKSARVLEHSQKYALDTTVIHPGYLTNEVSL